jgi:hypothetical protein
MPNGFVMILQKTDVGVGQSRAGTQRRSPEIFIPKQVVLPVRNLRVQVCNPVFWDWPGAFVEDVEYAGPMDQGIGKRDRHMTVQFLGNSLDVTMWYNPDKRDFRIRSETLRNAGQIGDLIRIERNVGNARIPFSIYIIRSSEPDYSVYLRYCVNQPANSLKRWGYYP